MSIRYKRTNWVRLGRLLPAWLLAGFISSLAFAVPVTTNYQGYLENTDGEPLDATVNMTVALYAAAQGGSALWTETHQNVEVTDGVFSLILGNTTSFDDDSLEGKRYLGVTVGSDPEMAPRQQLTSAFFAMRAGVADSVKAASVETEAIADGAVTADKIAPQTITGDRIADGVTITAAERQKLVDLGTGGVGSEPTFKNVVVEEQLNVKKHLKVGENSIHLTSGGGAPANEIYTSGDALSIQRRDNNGQSQNVGIGLDNLSSSGKNKLPKAKLKVKGVLKLSPVPDTELDFEISDSNGFKGIWAFYNETANEGEISSVNLSYPPRSYSPLIINGDNVIINQAQLDNSGNVDKNKLQPGTVSIGYGQDKLESDDSYQPGEKHKSPPFGLVVKGKVGIGTSKPQHELHLDIENAKIAFGDNNTFERANQYGAANVLVGEYDDEGVDSDKLQLHGKKGIYFTTGNYQGGYKRVAMQILSNGDICIGKCN